MKTPEKTETEIDSVDFSALERRAQEELLREKENSMKSHRVVIVENVKNSEDPQANIEEHKVSKEYQCSISDQSSWEPFLQG